MTDNETAAPDDRTNDFLNVEEVARGLVSRLSRLDEEANRYAGAGRVLNEAAQATRDLVDVVRFLGDDVAKAIDVISSVGGPEIITQLSLVQTQITDQSETLLKRLSSVESKITDQHDMLLKRIGLVVNLAGAAAVLALTGTVVALMK